MKRISMNGDLRHSEVENYVDRQWYLEQNPEVEMLGIDPVSHFLNFGSRLNRRPAKNLTIEDLRKAIKLSKQLANPDGVELENEGIHHTRGKRPFLPSLTTIILCAHETNRHLFGGERSFLDMATAISSLNVNLIITTPSNSNAEYLSHLQLLCCAVHTFPYRPDFSLSNDSGSVKKFEKIIAFYGADCIYANTIVLTAPLVAGSNFGIKTACHVRELINHDDALLARIGLAPSTILERLRGVADFFIANSLTTAAAFGSDVVVRNCVDINELDIENDVHGKLRVGLISSNIPKKGVADFVRIAELSGQAKLPIEFRLIGPENSFVETLIKEGLPENLTVAGYAESPLAAIKQVNVVLSLSQFAESFGRTVAEALAARRPVIAYDKGAIPELVSHKASGYLVEPGDFAGVTQHLRTLCKNPSIVADFGEAGRRHVIKNFSTPVYKRDMAVAIQRIFGRSISPNDELVPNVSVVVPVYNAPDDVDRCLASIVAWTPKRNVKIIVLDDCSPDGRVREVLTKYEGIENFTILRNERNLGYTKNINHGIALAGDDDVVLLNSDTVVTPGWLEGLRTTIYGAPNVATATAMSDNAGSFSFPLRNENNAKPEGGSFADYARHMVSQMRNEEPLHVPTGNGFCLYIRRDVFTQVGVFDEVAFPRGYGEENEFCLRAKAAGWANVISPASFVFHRRSASFGDSKTRLMEDGRQAVLRRYPSYERLVSKAFNSSEMQRFRKLCQAAVDAYMPSGVREDYENSTYHAGRLASLSSPSYLASALSDLLVDWTALSTNLDNRVRNRISIVVCAYNQVTLTAKCLNAILRNTPDHIDFEVVLIDNGSFNNFGSSFGKMGHARIHYVRSAINLNFSLGNNLGFKYSSGSKVVFLNNDTEVQPGWLKPLVDTLEDPDIMGSQPLLTYADGRVQCMGIVFAGKTPLGYPLYQGIGSQDKRVKKPRKFKAVTAACLAIRSEDFVRARGFDVRYVNGQEDVDLCLRLGNGRRAFSYCPESVVTHHEGRTVGRGKNVVFNRTQFVKRWTAIPRDDIDHYAVDGIVPEQYQPDNSDLSRLGIDVWTPSQLVCR